MFNIPFLKKKVEEEVKERPKKKHTHYEIIIYIDGVAGWFSRFDVTKSHQHIENMKKIRDCIQNNSVYRKEYDGGSIELPFPRKISVIEEKQWDCYKECENA
jgi:hypothetical protein